MERSHTMICRTARLSMLFILLIVTLPMTGLATASTPTPSILLIGDTPTPTASPQTPTPDFSSGSFVAKDGWSVEWDSEYWGQPDVVEDSRIVLQRGNYRKDVYILTMKQETDGRYCTIICANQFTFMDPEECQSEYRVATYGMEDAFGPDGKMLRETTKERSWAVYINARIDAYVYLECRILTPGTNYIQIYAEGMSKEEFNEMSPYLQQIISSIRLPGEELATPSGD